jgi:hypothetical protein
LGLWSFIEKFFLNRKTSKTENQNPKTFSTILNFFSSKCYYQIIKFRKSTDKTMVEREEEQPVIKVTDRRKFNIDGSVREGVEIEPEKPKTVPPVSEPTAAKASESVGTAPATEEISAASSPEETEAFDEESIPGAEDPASFVNFLSTLATNAAAALGAMPHPVTGQRSLDLDTGKYWLDVLGMLRDKTKGNLHPQEARLLDGLLGDLRMQYVQLVRATEERQKQQAAQKFSASDILRKK